MYRSYRHQIQPHEWTHPSDKQTIVHSEFSRPPVKSRASRAGLKRRIIKSSEVLPDNFAWHPNTLTDVRDQGQCGSCWAFAITSAMADRIMIQTKGSVNVPLSVQHLINCSSYPGNGPCDGNDVGWALAHAPIDGFVADSVRLYQMINGGNHTYPCQPETDPSEYDVKIPSHTSYCLTSGNHTTEDIQNMKAHIYHEGPIIGAMLAVYPDLSYYDGISIYDPAPGQISEGGHAIEILGWGKNSSGVEYWICRNSWGPNWPANHLSGMGKGWFYVKLGSNTCRMEEYAYSSVPDMINQANASKSSTTDAYIDKSGIHQDPSYTPGGSYTVSTDDDDWKNNLYQLLFMVVVTLILYRIVTRKR
jgi:cathepsin B